MTLPNCARCGQPRTPDQLWRGTCGNCRRHRCTQHPAGNPACYKRHHCRCDHCLHAESVRSKHARHAKATGNPSLRDTTPIREHLATLTASGMGRAEISRRAGVARSVLIRITRGDVRTVRQATATAILAVRPTPHAHHQTGRVDATGTRRRLWALMAIGWTQNQLAHQLNTTPSQIARLRHHPTCTAATRTRVAELYNQLWNQPRPDTPDHSASRARNLARANGYPPPLGWDDDTIDDPNAKPQGIGSDHHFHGEAALETAHLLGTDSAQGIARRLGHSNYDTLARTIEHTNTALAKRLRATKEVA